MLGQDLSVAGKRKGLAGERSGLFMEQIRLIKEMRESDRQRNKHTGTDVNPRWMVWENVPGAQSSNDGRDFLAVLEETAKVADESAIIPRLEGKNKWRASGCILGNGWSIAWRVHDSQYWNTAQRRKRICLLADFNGESAPEILFETTLWRETSEGIFEEVKSDIGEESRQEIQSQLKGMSWYFEQSEQERKNNTSDVRTGIDSTGTGTCGVISKGNGDCLLTKEKHTSLSTGGGQAGQGYPCILKPIAFTTGMNINADEKELSYSLLSRDYKDPQSVCYKKGSHPQNAEEGQSWKETDVNDTLNPFDANENRTPTLIVQKNKKDIGIDLYNQTITGDVLCPITAACGGSSTSGGQVLTIEEIEENKEKNKEEVICFEPGATSRVGGHVYKDKSPTLRAAEGDNRPAIAYGISSYDSNSMKSKNPNAGIYEAETSKTLDINGGNPACNQGGIAIVQEEENKAFAVNQRDEIRDIGDKSVALQSQPGMKQQTFVIEGSGQRPSHKGNGYAESDVSYTLNATTQHGVAYAIHSHSQDGRYKISDINQSLSANMSNDPLNGGFAMVLENHPQDSRIGIKEDNIFQTLSSTMGTGGNNVPMVMEEKQRMIVRRLTPLECTRLQAFPDFWVNIGEWIDSKGKKHKESDTPKYKALGNSIALPFWEWLAKRIAYYSKEKLTMASLFDGIGGFPLSFARAGIEPIWSSEIEEFPIAVLKKHFGDEDLGIEGDYKKYI